MIFIYKENRGKQSFWNFFLGNSLVFMHIYDICVYIHTHIHIEQNIATDINLCRVQATCIFTTYFGKIMCI